ncbi:MAG: 50S ribosomal protein L10 [Crocinitomicaceae bacterium]|nr:50S ribosomal protein L10 [Crocinitomicaceae bacterium]
MTSKEKSQYVDELVAELNEAGVFYLADTSELTVESVNALRRTCFKNNIKLRVVKNTLLKKAMEQITDKNFGELTSVLAGPTSIMYSEIGNAPAKVIKDFRKKHSKPILKGAFIEEAIFIGDNQVDFLTSIKSKEELLGDIIMLLQSPAKNVVSGLQSGGNKLSGILKTLSEK